MGRTISLLGLTAGLMLIGCTTPFPTGEPSGPVGTEATGAPLDLTLLNPETACEGQEVERGGQNLLELRDGSLVTMAPMAINVDGSGRAYHPENAAGGAILHLCNAGEVHLPDGSRYHGSISNAVCTGKFMDDVARIGAAGWTDGDVGAVRWYGILAQGSAQVAGRRVPRAVPVVQDNGFYVSPTALADRNFPLEDQGRYVDALTVHHAVVRRDSGIPLGTFGVAFRGRNCGGGNCRPVPFIVADIGPRIGEGSVALSRAVKNLPATTNIDRSNRFQGVIEGDDVIWIFFGGQKAQPPYSASHVHSRAQQAFEDWGGPDRLARCNRRELPVANAG